MSVHLRDLRPGERDTVQEIFDGLSAHSRLLRFHGPVARLTPLMLDRLAAVDGCDHVAVVAEMGRGRRRRPVGLVRLVRTGSTTAELAVEVVDAAQGRGIGRQLLAEARARAVELGVREVRAEVLADNAPMLHLVRELFSGVMAFRRGPAWELHCPVPSGDVEFSDVLATLAGFP